MRTLIIIMLATAVAATAHADRIKDLASIDGVRDNHLTGFGIVVGLDGSGDDVMSPVVKTSLVTMLKRLGITIDPTMATMMKMKNVAAVMLTAELPAFGRPGQKIDVTISSMGNAKSLSGGTLLAAPLKGPDGKTWALAQGALSIGGFTAEGASGSSTKKNHTLVGEIPGGATLEGAAPTVMPTKELTLILNTQDFTTATRVQAAIEAQLPGVAKTRDASAVTVLIGADWKGKVPDLIAKLEAIDVDPDVRAKVVVDEKTGTVVVGEAVTLRPAAITFGSLTVEVTEAPTVVQPNAPVFGGKGVKTKVVPNTQIKVEEPNNTMKVLGKATTVGDVAAAFAALGAKPRDLVSILRALKAAGALRAELETM
ncbi:MAG TPA: flagellar basal body P-ring protein FlgI [Kofleriaceae bacterium]|nr:flagellar basal body P-ring protein FlgI [Kofleriaceae bacterium]